MCDIYNINDGNFNYMAETKEFEDLVGLYYDPRCNHFEDADGDIVFDIFKIISPNDIYLFRQKQDYMMVPHRQRKDIRVELHYPAEGDCNYCDNFEACHGYLDECEDDDDEHHYM